MTIVTNALSSLKQDRIVQYAKTLSTVLLISAIVVFDEVIIAETVATRWIPLLGLVLGICFACLGFFVLVIIRRRCTECGKRIVSDNIREKTVLISGFSLLVFGALVMVLNNSMALVLNIHWLHIWGSILGTSMVCIGIWMFALFAELFKGDRKLRTMGLFLSGLLFVEIFLKFGGWW